MIIHIYITCLDFYTQLQIGMSKNLRNIPLIYFGQTSPERGLPHFYGYKKANTLQSPYPECFSEGLGKLDNFSQPSRLWIILCSVPSPGDWPKWNASVGCAALRLLDELGGRRVRSGYFSWFPPCEVTLGWLCPKCHQSFRGYPTELLSFRVLIRLFHPSWGY